jgi:hypothetical protein
LMLTRRGVRLSMSDHHHAQDALSLRMSLEKRSLDRQLDSESTATCTAVAKRYAKSGCLTFQTTLTSAPLTSALIEVCASVTICRSFWRHDDIPSSSSFLGYQGSQPEGLASHRVERYKSASALRLHEETQHIQHSKFLTKGQQLSCFVFL